MSRTAYIEGIALWSARLPGWDAAAPILRGEVEPPATPAPRPSPGVLAPTERRRAPDTVAIALEVAGAACASAGRDPAALPSIFASTHGDLAISDYMCGTLAKTPSLVSPIKFHNSVHNAAAGYWTIGTGCMAPYTAISAWQHTFGMALVEAFAQLATTDAPVLVVAYDIEARGPMASVVESRSPLGAALVLAPTRSERTRCALTWRTVRSAGPESLAPALAALVPGSPLAGTLSLFAALAAGAGGRVRQSVAPRLALEMELTPSNRATETEAA